MRSPPANSSLWLVGPGADGSLLEVGVANADRIDFIVHAMSARKKFRR